MISKDIDKLVNRIKYLLLFFSFICISSCDQNKENTIEFVHKKINTGVYDTSTTVYSVAIEGNSLKIDKLKRSELSDTYCKKFDLFFIGIITFNPLIVECRGVNTAGDIITDGRWHYKGKLEFKVIGENKKHILRSDFSLVDKKTGKITPSTITDITKKNRKNNKMEQIYASTISMNNRYFIFDDQVKTVSEVNLDGTKTELVNINQPLFGDRSVVKMTVSDNGHYLFLLLSRDIRGMGSDLFFKVIDVRSQSIIYSKTLQKGIYFNNEYLYYQSGKVVLIYRTTNKEVNVFLFTINLIDSEK